MIVKTNTYQISVSDIFNSRSADFEYFSIYTRDEDFAVQFPIINMALSEIKDFEEYYPADSYEASIKVYFNSKRKSKDIAISEIVIAGKKAYLGKAVWSVEAKGETVEMFSMFVNIPLEDGFVQEFSADCEVTVRNKYEPLFHEAIESIEWFGDFKKYIDLHKTHLEEQEKRIDELTAKMQNQTTEVAEEKKPEYEVFKIPENGEESFKVGDYEFEINKEESNWAIPDFSKELVVKIVATTKELTKGKKEQLFDEYNDEGRFELEIALKEVYKNGQPEGVFEIEEDKCKSLYAYVRKNGFYYTLDFFGTITVRNGWVAYNGEFKTPYNDGGPNYKVTIYKKFDSELLVWRNYNFQKLEEAEQAPRNLVHFLTMRKPEFEVLPDSVLEMTNLEELTIENNTWEMMPLHTISDDISQLQKLEKLSINGAPLKVLPDGITRLKKLSSLFVNNCELVSIPKGVFKLPEVKFLYLSKNKISELPTEIDMPCLEVINLSENQLVTLPVSLSQQPKLRSIDMEDNPWEAIPTEFENIKELGLSIEDKNRFFDYNYYGADGKGLAEWDDTMYYSQGDEKLIEPVRSLTHSEEVLKPHEDALLSLVKKALVFNHTEEEDYSALGNHRFGGMPDLPNGMAYPRFANKDGSNYCYEFIAQVNCADVAHLQDYLPRTGILFFFLSTLHDIYQYADDHVAKVIYFDGNKDGLVSGKNLHFEESNYFEMYGSGYKGFKVETKIANSVPAFYSISRNEYVFKGDASALKDKEDLFDDFSDYFEEPINEVHTNSHKINAYGFSQNEYPELQVAQVHKGNPEDWIVLLEVKSNGDFQWGDAGDLFFVIHKSDLAKGDFSNVKCTMYSS